MTNIGTPQTQVEEELAYADLVASVGEESHITPEDIVNFQYYSGDEFLAALTERAKGIASA